MPFKSFFQKRFLCTHIPRLLPMGLITMLVLLHIGYLWGLMLAPNDAVQGNMVKIMYLHVPCAWLSVVCYGVTAAFSAMYLIWKLPVAHLLARSTAMIGICFTAVCLITGSLWGINTWGTWWVWDARLTSVLVLFFLYVGFLLMGRAFGSPARRASSSSLLAVVGLLNLPIIKWSVTWWSTLHQGATFLKAGGPSIDVRMLAPLLICALGWIFYALSFISMHLYATLKKETP